MNIQDQVGFSFSPFMCFCLSPLGTFVIVVLAGFESPVHDVANHRGGDQTQELEDAKDGRVDAH